MVHLDLPVPTDLSVKSAKTALMVPLERKALKARAERTALRVRTQVPEVKALMVPMATTAKMALTEMMVSQVTEVRQVASAPRDLKVAKAS